MKGEMKVLERPQSVVFRQEKRVASAQRHQDKQRWKQLTATATPELWHAYNMGMGGAGSRKVVRDRKVHIISPYREGSDEDFMWQRGATDGHWLEDL